MKGVADDVQKAGEQKELADRCTISGVTKVYYQWGYLRRTISPLGCTISGVTKVYHQL